MIAVIELNRKKLIEIEVSRNKKCYTIEIELSRGLISKEDIFVIDILKP